MYLVASEVGLQSVFWKKQSAVPVVKSLRGDAAALQILLKADQQLQEYLEGGREEFDLPFDVKGTPFQKRVWEQLKKIPYGKTLSYKDIARQIKNENAVRAVGSANARNPLCVIVPCHRVIAADGSLGGYSGGLDIKTKLLELESGGALGF